MHARYFSPNLGRFLSVDPVGCEVGSSQSWNRYTYALNNPLIMFDPTGMAEKRTFWQRVWGRFALALSPKAPVSEEEQEARVNALLEGAGIDPEQGLNSTGTGAAANIADGARDAIATLGAELSEETTTWLVIGAAGRATKILRFGGGYKAEARAFHREIKPQILKAVGSFSGKVGNNPDVKIVDGIIHLVGNGPYRGRTMNTGLRALDFFGQ